VSFLAVEVCALLGPAPTATAGAAPPSTFRADPTYLIDTWETDQGLPENSATAMVQDADGYLWFGTFDGLVRFDGLKFTAFDPSNDPQLPGREIVNLHLDKKGRLWASTYRGLAMREGISQPWRTIQGGSASTVVRTFADRPNGDLLITTFDGGILQYSAGTGLTALAAPPGSEPGKGYLGFCGVDGKWWVVQPQRFIGSWNGQQWTQAQAALDQSVTSSALGAGPARNADFWLLLPRELRKYRGGQEVARVALSEPANDFWSLHEDHEANVWICSYYSGLRRVEPSGHVRKWTTDNGLAHNGVRFVFEGPEQNIWVGTSGGGLARFKPKRVQMIDSAQGLEGRVVKSISPDSAGRMWIATYGKGLFRTKTSVGPATAPATTPATTVVPVTLPARSDAGPPVYIQSVCNDRAGRTWVGTFNHGIRLLEGSSTRAIELPDEVGSNVIALFEDSKGSIWASGGSAGIAEFDRDGRLARQFTAAQGLPKGSVRCFAEGGGVIWLTNTDGVFRLEGNRFVEVKDGEGRPLRDINTLKSDADGTIWMGSVSQGLLRWKDGSIAKIDARTGLPVQSVQGILEDDHGYFWLASNRGILRVSRKNLEAVANGSEEARLALQRLDLSDGLASVECSGGVQPSCARDAAGRLWFATMKGVASVDPATFQVNTLPPPLQIEKIVYHRPAADSSGGDVHVSVSSPFPKALRLPAGSRQIEIHYTALSFTAPEKIRFQTRLGGEGEERDWRDVGDERIARFYELPSGAYSLSVRAANEDGVWNERGAELAFEIQPFYWETGWFRAGLILALFAAGAAFTWWFAHLRHRRARQAIARAQRQSVALLSLSLSPSAASGDVRSALREITEQAARVVPASRVSVWLINHRSNELYLADSFTVRTQSHEEGQRLPLGDCRAYLQNLEGGRVIHSDAALHDETRPSAIHDGLHAPVRLSGKLSGVVCLGIDRAVQDDQISFASALASQVAEVLLNAERERTARDLRESEARFRSMANTAPVMIWMSGLDSGCTFFNETWLQFTGRTMEQELGDQWASGVHPEDLAQCLDVYLKAFHARQQFSMEYRLRHFGGEYRWVMDQGVPRFGPDGTFVGYIGCASDIDERRRAETEVLQQRSELQHLSRVMILGELSGSLAHELNQPLTAILSNAQAALRFLSRDEVDLAEVRGILKDIVDEDKRAGEVIHRLRLLLKKGEVQHQPLDVNEVVADVLRLINSELMNHETSVSIELAAELPSISGDRVQLQQVLLNLILNGCDAMNGVDPPDRQLVVRTESASGNGNGVRVSVSDCGCGIPSERMEHIFEPFYTTKTNGMGLGLAVCRTIVLAHSGLLSAMNNPAGRGATFYLTLPAAAHNGGQRNADGDADATDADDDAVPSEVLTP
jgi:PAS domain S-box-containing protein